MSEASRMCRKKRRALWAAIPKKERPTWTEFNTQEQWKEKK